MPSPTGSRRFLLFLLLAAIALFLYVASPFAKPILVAATITAVLAPWHARLTAALGGRRAVSAALLTGGVLVAIVGPLAFLASTLVIQVVAGVRWLRDAIASEGMAGLVARLPEPLRDLAERVNADIPALLDQARSALATTESAAAVGGILSATGSLVAKT